MALVLLTLGILLGIVTSLRVGDSRWPRFAIGRLHKNLTLLAIVFVALHVLTTVADGYAPIGLKDAVIPFASPYRPVWLGLGAVAFDLLLALVLTSYLRRRIGARVWRSVHWLAYAAWPIALVHALGTGTDSRTSWLVLLGGVSLAVVVLAALARIVVGPGLRGARLAGAAAAIALPLLVAGWYRQGPARLGWAARAGTPARLIASRRTTVAVRATAPAPPRPFTASASGSVSNTTGADGLLHVVISLRLRGGPGGALRIDLRGAPSGGGVVMDASGVSFVPATTGVVYTGSVTSLEGQTVGAAVSDPLGDRLQLVSALRIDANRGVVSGTVAGTLA